MILLARNYNEAFGFVKVMYLWSLFSGHGICHLPSVSNPYLPVGQSYSKQASIFIRPEYITF